MSTSQKSRLRRNVSFSNHEKDIYDYLEQCDNASALIKKLVKEHMMIEKFTSQGLIDKDLILNNINYNGLIKNRDVKHETTNEENNTNDNNGNIDNDSSIDTNKNSCKNESNISDSSNNDGSDIDNSDRDADKKVGTENTEEVQHGSNGSGENEDHGEECLTKEENENKKRMEELPF